MSYEFRPEDEQPKAVLRGTLLKARQEADLREQAARNAAAAARPSWGNAIHVPTPGPSWGPEMPAEENQFNYGGHFTAYFEHIFRDDFPACFVSREVFDGGRRVVYRFYRDGVPALLVELLGQGSKAARQRRLCARDGIPYLRFYYNHHGWWNTRAYVVRRIREAMG